MLWNELVKLALLGTERSSLSPVLKAQLQEYGIDTNKEITEVILEGATLQAALRKAGYEPTIHKGDSLLPSPPEELTVCSKESAHHLSLILSGRYAAALPEFISVMAACQKCLPPELLPELLDKCIKDETLWQQLKITIGNRGKWLISLNPVWQKLRINASPEKWETGTKKERVAILKALRQTKPEAGLELVISTWVEDGLSEKIAFLKCLEIGLSELEEPFLEGNLDFPRKEVREIAAHLLSKLSNSQLQQRIFTQLQERIAQENGMEKPAIILPKASDKILLRDGINPKKKWKRGGETTGMLFQMVAILPPEKWEQHLQQTPAEILRFFSKSEWAMMLVEALAKAAALHDAPNWKAALLQFWLDHYTKRNWTKLDIRPILMNLPNTVFNEVLFQKLKATPFLPEEHSPLIQLLKKEGYIWEDRLTNTFMAQLKEWISNNATYSWTGSEYRNVLKKAAYAVNPAIEKSLSQFWLGDSTSWAGWEKNIQQFLTILGFRKEMLAELRRGEK